jgi:hypothetical protein
MPARKNKPPLTEAEKKAIAELRLKRKIKRKEKWFGQFKKGLLKNLNEEDQKRFNELRLQQCELERNNGNMLNNKQIASLNGEQRLIFNQWSKIIEEIQELYRVNRRTYGNGRGARMKTGANFLKDIKEART